MKKAILFLFLLGSVAAYSQSGPLDTIQCRNFTLTAQNMAVFASFLDYNPNDSAGYSIINRLRTQVKAQNPTSWTVNIVIDSLPGRYVIAMYRKFRYLPTGATAILGTGILTAIQSYSSLTPYLSGIDAEFTNMLLDRRQIGKTILLNN